LNLGVKGGNDDLKNLNGLCVFVVLVFAVLVFVFVVVVEFVTDLVIEPQRRSLGSKGWRSGENTRLPPMWSGLESWRRRHVLG